MLEANVPDSTAGPVSYDLMFELGRDLMIRQGLSVILDSPAGYSQVIARAEKLAGDAHSALKFILCLAEHDIRNARLSERAGRPSQWTADPEIVDDGSERWVPLAPPSALVLDTGLPPEQLVPRAIEYVRAD